MSFANTTCQYHIVHDSCDSIATVPPASCGEDTVCVVVELHHRCRNFIGLLAVTKTLAMQINLVIFNNLEKQNYLVKAVTMIKVKQNTSILPLKDYVDFLLCTCSI